MRKKVNFVLPVKLKFTSFNYHPTFPKLLSPFQLFCPVSNFYYFGFHLCGHTEFAFVFIITYGLPI